MTYCLAIALEEGLVFTSDSRTNAGIDHVSTYSKMYVFGEDGQRKIVLLSAGNLATTQAVVTRLRRDIEDQKEVNLSNVSHMSDVAEYVGVVSRQQQDKHLDLAEKQKDFNPEASFIIGGQLSGCRPEIYMIYAAGNYITTSEYAPYLQIGESKYGKPILDRIITAKTPLEDAARCALVSMDSTMRSNASVGPPVELLVYRKDSLLIEHRLKLDADASYLYQLRKSWDESTRKAFGHLPKFEWESEWLSPYG